MADNAGPLLLYVEDEPVIRDLGVIALEEAGFAVDAIDEGGPAIAALEARGAAFRALITDIDLAGGVCGWDVARRARELFADLPVIYVSGGSAHDWASMGVPGSIMIAKPYASAQLVVAVSTAMLGSDAA